MYVTIFESNHCISHIPSLWIEEMVALCYKCGCSETNSMTRSGQESSHQESGCAISVDALGCLQEKANDTFIRSVIHCVVTKREGG